MTSKTNIKYVFIWTTSLLVFGLGIQLYFQRYYSVEASYPSVAKLQSFVEVKTGNVDMTSSHAGIKSYRYINASSILQQKNKTKAKSIVENVFLNPSKLVPSAILKRMDKETRNVFLSNVAKWRRTATSTQYNDSAVSGATTYQEVLKSMGYNSRLPDVINIGVKKGGTTALMFYLKYHPQIQTCHGANEVHYFDWKYHKGLHWYESQMKFARDDQLVYEKTPRYFVHDAVAHRIHRDLGDNIRFLLCVRDPVSRLVSDFHFTKHIRTTRNWKKKQTIAKESQRFMDTIFKRGVIDETNPMVLTSNYALHFKRWLTFFKRDQFLIIDNYEMMSNVLDTLMKVESFLGLKPFFRKGMFYKSKHNESCLINKSMSSCPPNIGGSLLPKPRLSDEVQRHIRDYYRPYNKEFEALTGRKFTWTNL